MIAPSEKRPGNPRYVEHPPAEDRVHDESPHLQRAHMHAIRREEHRLPQRLHDAIATSPTIAVVAAVTTGVALGWLLKRKTW